MKQQKSIKLALISMLSNPDVILEDVTMTNEIREVPTKSPMELAKRVPTGRSYYSITIFKELEDEQDEKRT